MPSSKITSKGQVTIPKAVREALGLDMGDRIGFHIRDDGVVELHAASTDLLSLHQMVKPSRRGVSVPAMNAAIRKRKRT